VVVHFCGIGRSQIPSSSAAWRPTFQSAACRKELLLHKPALPSSVYHASYHASCRGSPLNLLQGRHKPCSRNLKPMQFSYIHSFTYIAQPTSEFAAAYSKGIRKTEYWRPVLEDSMNLIAKLPG